MPQVKAQGKTLICQSGDNLRQVCLANNIELYNGNAKWINCRGIGTCGTCSVEIIGDVSPPNWKDKTRHSLPPHTPQKPRRLACQTQVLGDIQIKKYDGFWGQGEQLLWWNCNFS